MEEWRDLPGYEGRYMVSNTGKMYSKHYKREFLGYPDRYGYRYFSIQLGRGKTLKLKVHKCVMLAFIGPCQDEQQVRHLDGNKNNNALNNLAYGTALENSADRVKHCTQVRGSNSPRAIINEDIASRIKCWINEGYTSGEINIMCQASISIVEKIRCGDSWVHIEPQINIKSFHPFLNKTQFETAMKCYHYRDAGLTMKSISGILNISISAVKRKLDKRIDWEASRV